MRYTLRFLTVDQFNRLATLITSMNLLREKIYSNILGNELISLGVWVGRASSINKHDEAIKLIKQTTKPSKLRDKDPTFILESAQYASIIFLMMLSLIMNQTSLERTIPLSAIMIIAR